MKVYTTGGSYFDHNRTVQQLDKYLTSDTHIFITTAQLLPLFSGRINKDFRNFSCASTKKVHWYFPIADSPGFNFKKLMDQSVNNDISLMNGSVWGSLKKFVLFDKDSLSACFPLKGGEHFMRAENPKIIYEDGDVIFLTSSRIFPSDDCSF